MSNVLYTPAKESLLKGDFNLGTDTIKAILVDAAAYTFSATHQFLTSIPGGSIVATITLASKTTTNGTFDAADFSFPLVPAGPACEYVILYKDTGVAGTSRLLCKIDTAAGLPCTPDGNDIDVVLDAAGIFSLA